MNFPKKINAEKNKVNNSQTTSNPYAIEIKNFTKKFNKTIAVDNISMNVTKGRIHGFIGPNGSGKTTTIKSLIGAIVPTSGKLLINNLPSNSVAAHGIVGYIPENARFPKHLDLLHYLTEMAYLRGMPLKTAKMRANKIINSLQLETKKRKNPNVFSSGMKKKVLLAQALLSDPDVLILDEPAANLDPTARISLFNDLKTIRAEGKTILICSHILSELQEIADEITILNFGNIVFSGPLITQEENYYSLTVLETEMYDDFKRIIKKMNYQIYEENPKENNIVVLLPNAKEDIKLLVKECFDKKVILITIKPYISDISEIYNSYVYKINKNIDKTTAIIKN